MQDDSLATTEGPKECVIEGEQEWGGCCSAILGVATVVLCFAGYAALHSAC